MSTAEAPAGPRKTLLYVALGVVVVAVLAVAGLFLLRTPTEDTAAPLPTTGDSPPIVAEATPTPSDSPAPLFDEATFAVFEARDPFEQLVEDDAEGESGTSDTGGDTGGATPSSSSTPPFSVPPASETPTPAATGQADGTRIELVDIYDDGGVPTAQVTVNGVGYDAQAGETFAGGDGMVDDIDPPCATIIYRDNRMNLCEGEAVRK
jgi:hypothetical protein